MRLTLAALLLTTTHTLTLAQTPGAPTFIASPKPLHKVAYGEMLERPAMLCADDRAFAFEVAREGLNPIYRYFAYAYDLQAGGILAARDLGLPEKKNARPIEAFFLAGDKPAYLLRQWDEKSGTLTLQAQVLDPSTLEPSGTPVTIGTAPLDPGSYKGYLALGVTVDRSPDGQRTVFCFDQVQDKGMQVVMCWVTDAALTPVWQGVYRIPVQSLGYQRELLLSNDGNVYLKANGVQLTAADVKDNGKVKTKTNYASMRSRAWFALNGKEQHMWDGTLPDGRVLTDAGMVVHGDRLLMGGFVADGGAKAWVRFAMDKAFLPVDVSSGALATPGLGEMYRPKLVVDNDGTAFLYASSDMRNALLVAFDAKGGMAWEKYVKGDALYPTGFARKGRLFVPMLAKDDAVAAFAKKGTLATGGVKLHPVVFTADASGNLALQDVLAPADGNREIQLDGMTGRPDYSIMAHTGAYIDFSYAKDRPGIVLVELDQ